MDRSEEELPLTGKAALDRHVRELLEHALRPMSPMVAELGRNALSNTHPEAILDAYVYDDDEPQTDTPPPTNQ